MLKSKLTIYCFMQYLEHYIIKTELLKKNDYEKYIVNHVSRFVNDLCRCK